MTRSTLAAGFALIALVIATPADAQINFSFGGTNSNGTSFNVSGGGGRGIGFGASNGTSGGFVSVGGSRRRGGGFVQPVQVVQPTIVVRQPRRSRTVATTVFNQFGQPITVAQQIPTSHPRRTSGGGVVFVSSKGVSPGSVQPIGGFGNGGFVNTGFPQGGTTTTTVSRTTTFGGGNVQQVQQTVAYSNLVP